MSLWKIAWRSIQQRGLASMLTALSMALGVMMVVAVLSIYGIVSESFRKHHSLGYNMIVGAKGGKLQLTLNTVYYLSQPVENISYDYYLEFFGAEQRDRELKHSLRARAHQARWEASGLQTLSASALGAPGPSALGSLLALGALQQADAQRLDTGRDGRFSGFTQFAIPLCLGDYFGHFRVVGTTPAMFDELVHDVETGAKFEFAQGRNFQHKSEEYGYFEGVVGATVAREMGVRLGDVIHPTHGDPEGHGHDEGFHVVGILKPTGAPQDRAVFVNMEGFYLMEDHAKPLEQERFETDQGHDVASTGGQPQPATSGGSRDYEPLPVEQREVTAILVRTVNPLVAPGLQSVISKGPTAQAVMPIREIYNLFDAIVRPLQMLLLTLTAMICVVSGIGILVSIYNSMSDRRHEIAVMRALGAGRGTVMSVILLESVILSLGGGMLGWVFGHTLNWAASPYIEARTGVSVGFWNLAPAVNVLDVLGVEGTIGWLNWLNKLQLSPEFLVIPPLILLAIIVGFLPALSAYRTDVARWLSP